ncbi:hypothetical protein MUG91_G241n2 [Manis pentadactyla]|nr:hypothetical protein MUG91_G241n2 [Manis pentadactyla]
MKSGEVSSDLLIIQTKRLWLLMKIELKVKMEVPAPSPPKAKAKVLEAKKTVLKGIHSYEDREDLNVIHFPKTQDSLQLRKQPTILGGAPLRLTSLTSRPSTQADEMTIKK